MRTPNTACFICEKPIYRRPRQFKEKNYCQKCYGISQRRPSICLICKKEFPAQRRAKTCSEECFKICWAQKIKGRVRPRRNGNPKTARYIKKHMIAEQGHFCSRCKNSEWQGCPIVLTIDHIDGNNKNNERNNLRILCWNCHALTPTFMQSRPRRRPEKGITKQTEA